MKATRSFSYALAALTVIMFAGFAGEAQSGLKVWTDTFDPEPNIYFTRGTVLTYEHDITDDGFNPDNMIVFGGSIDFEFRDDSRRDGLEIVRIDLPGVFGDRTVEVDFDNVELGLSFLSVVSLNNNGKMDVTLRQRRGDFFFNEATLTAKGVATEPMTLGVLGVGLIGLGALARRRRLAA